MRLDLPVLSSPQTQMRTEASVGKDGRLKKEKNEAIIPAAMMMCAVFVEAVDEQGLWWVGLWGFHVL